jgi:dynein heavy chain
MFLEDVTLLAAMGPPGGGRTNITARFVRHFNILAYTELDNNTISGIFSKLAKHFLRKF